MSSEQASDQREFAEHKPRGFVKSVIKALSGSRFMTPDGPTRNSPTNDAGLTDRDHGQHVPELFSEGMKELESTGDDPLVFPGERGYEPENLSVPMEATKKQLRYIGESDELSSSAELIDKPGTSDSYLTDLVSRTMGGEEMARFRAAGFDSRHYFGGQTKKTSTGPFLPLSRDPLPHSKEPSHFRGGDHIHGMGRDVIDETDIGSSSQVFSSFPLYQPSGKSLPTGVNGLESHPYFRSTAPDGLTIRDFDGSPSLRVGQQHSQNITQRDAKRPKERSKDKAYKQRFSMVSSGDMGEHRLSLEFQTDPRTEQVGADIRVTPAPSRHGNTGGPRYSQSSVVGGKLTQKERVSLSPPSCTYEIVLVYSGARVLHRVSDSMLISQLCMEAGSVFGWTESHRACFDSFLSATHYSSAGCDDSWPSSCCSWLSGDGVPYPRM